MKTYYVTVKQTLEHFITIEADSEEEARKIAITGDDSEPGYLTTDTMVVNEEVIEIDEAEEDRS